MANAEDENTLSMALVNPEDLVGRSFLLEKQKDGQQLRARIVSLIEDSNANLEDNKERIKFLLKMDDDKSEEVISYNQLMVHLAKDSNNDIVWKFKRIASHQGPLTKKHPDYKGS